MMDRRTLLTSGAPTPLLGGHFAGGGGVRPDGHTLFVHSQASAGMTFAIRRPWASIGV